MEQKVFNGNNIDLLKQYPHNYFDAIVTDPPYGLGKEPDATELMKDWIDKGYHEVKGSGFMGKEWDAFVPQPIFWKEVFRVLKHGGHVLAFYGTRTYDWGVMAMRFAGFEVKDCLQWNFGSGFPKSHNIHNILKNDLQCKVEKKNVMDAIMSSFQSKKAIEMDGQNIVAENVLAKVKEGGTIELVKTVTNNSILQKVISIENQGAVKEHFVLINVNLNGKKRILTLKIILIGKEENLLEPMDTLELTWEKENIDLNILSLWKNISEEELKKERMFTTLTGLEQTIELKICNYFLNPNIQKFIVNNHSALKPANEPIVLARKPLEKGLSIAENVLKWGTGAINIDGCRVGSENRTYKGMSANKPDVGTFRDDNWIPKDIEVNVSGRFPANIILTHHPECECKGLKKVGSGKDGGYNYEGNVYEVEGFVPKNSPNANSNYGKEEIEDWDCHPDCPIKILDEQSGETKSPKSYTRNSDGFNDKIYGSGMGEKSGKQSINFGDSGGASRFFYVAKASKSERNKGLEGFEEKQSKKMDGGKFDSASTEATDRKMSNFHPTVKPIKLMQYLVTLITPPNGIVLDPFCGSGTTGIACKLEGVNFVGMEMDAEYCKIAEARINNYVEEKQDIKKSDEKNNSTCTQTSLF